MMSDEKSDERGFSVVDRRASAESQQDTGAVPPPLPDSGLPQVDFSSFCLSLATSALYHLGVVGDPETGTPAAEKSPPLAKQTIDALEMLRDKTRGNLDEEEGRLLDGLLYELRMRFVEAGKGT